MSSLELVATATAARKCAFDRALLVHTSEDPEVDLLHYAAMLSARETTIAAYPFDGILRSMAATARQRFEAHGASAPILRAMPELDFDWVCDAASTADLLIIQPRSALGGRNTLARRILSKSPCSVCLAPERPPSRISRVLAGIKLDETGRAVMERSVSLCRSVGADELIVVYCCAPDVYLDLDEERREQFRSERMLDLYRFMARCGLRGVSCTPVLEESIEPAPALAQLARCQFADLVVVGKRAGLRPRMATALMRECSAPVMQILLPPLASGVRGKLRQIFSNPEPKFN